MRTPEEHRRFTARRHLIPLLVRHCWSPYASRPQQPGFATRYTTTLYLPSSHPSNGIHHTSYRPTATLYLQSCCIMLAVCMPQIPCERRHRPRVAHKGLYSIFSSLLRHSFMVASRFRALWDIPLSASLCAFHPLLSHPLPTTISVFLFSFFLSFPLIVRSRTEPQEFEFHLRYIRSYLSLLSSFFSLFLSRPFPARPRVLCAAIDDSSPEYRIYPFHHRELERDRPEIERIYIYIYRFPAEEIFFAKNISSRGKPLFLCCCAGKG